MDVLRAGIGLMLMAPMGDGDITVHEGCSITITAPCGAILGSGCQGSTHVH